MVKTIQLPTFCRHYGIFNFNRGKFTRGSKFLTPLIEKKISNKNAIDSGVDKVQIFEINFHVKKTTIFAYNSSKGTLFSHNLVVKFHITLHATIHCKHNN